MFKLPHSPPSIPPTPHSSPSTGNQPLTSLNDHFHGIPVSDSTLVILCSSPALYHGDCRRCDDSLRLENGSSSDFPTASPINISQDQTPETDISETNFNGSVGEAPPPSPNVSSASLPSASATCCMSPAASLVSVGTGHFSDSSDLDKLCTFAEALGVGVSKCSVPSNLMAIRCPRTSLTLSMLLRLLD